VPSFVQIRREMSKDLRKSKFGIHTENGKTERDKTICLHGRRGET
jgi:hypothetical protein